MTGPDLPASPADALALMDAWWPRWTAFVDAEAEAGRAETRGADGWTLAEAVAHVARWQDWSVPRAETLAAGARIAEVDVDGQNAAWAEADRGLPFAEARLRADRAQAAFRQCVAAIAPARWSRALGRLVVANTSEHYHEHMGWHSSATR